MNDAIFIWPQETYHVVFILRSLPFSINADQFFSSIWKFVFLSYMFILYLFPTCSYIVNFSFNSLPVLCNPKKYHLIELIGRPTSKILFLSWVPEGCKIKSKMTYAGSKEAIKRVLMGVSVTYQANGFDELDFDTCILPAVKKFA